MAWGLDLKEWASVRPVESGSARHLLGHFYQLMGIPIKPLFILKLTTLCFLRAYVLLGSNTNIPISIKLHFIIIMVTEEAAFSSCSAF